LIKTRLFSDFRDKIDIEILYISMKITNFFKSNRIATKFLIVSTVLFFGLAAFLAYFTTLAGISQFNIIYLVVFEAGILWLLFILLSSRFLVQRPIEELKSAAMEVTQGNLKKEVKVSGTGGRDEISDLAGVFNEITIKLRTAQESLEQRVKERAAIIEEERRLDEAKSQLISIASDQLQTSLVALHRLVGSLQGSLNLNKGDEKQRLYFDSITIATRRLVKLAEDLLSVSKIQPRFLKGDRELLDVAKFIDDFVSSIEPYAILNKHTVIFTKEDNLPKAQIDSQMLYNVLQNLVSNAINYSPDETAIAIHAERDGDSMLRIAVSNKGTPIPKQEQSRLFEKFYRAESTKGMREEGTGLGLFIVKSLIESVGGKVGITSEDGNDTTFHFTVPLSLGGNATP